MSYLLRVIKANNIKSMEIKSGQLKNVMVHEYTQIQLVNSQGKLVINPRSEVIDGDLWVYLEQDKKAAFILKDYEKFHFISDSSVLAEMNSSYATVDTLGEIVPFTTEGIEVLLASEVIPVSTSGLGKGALIGLGALVGVGGVLGAAGKGSDNAQSTSVTNKDTMVNKPIIIVEDITGDNFIDSKEVSSSKTTIRGSLGNIDKDVEKIEVTIRVNGKKYTAVVKDKSFSVDVDTTDLAADTKISARVKVSDKDNNTAISDNVDVVYSVADNKPTITFNDITSDNIVNIDESSADVTVTGKTSNVTDGTSIILTIGKVQYSGIVNNNLFSINVDGGTLANHQKITASLTSGGNQSVTTDHTYQVDTSIESPVITINSVTADNKINFEESMSNITLTGSVTNAYDGVKIYFTIGSKIYEATVQGGEFSVMVSGDVLKNNSTIKASITVSDSAENTVMETKIHTYSVDLTQPTKPVVTINNVTTDNILNIDESGSDVDVSGNVSGLQNGDNVKVSCGCPSCSGVSWKELTTNVDSKGNFSVAFDGEDVAAGTVIKVFVPKTNHNDQAENTKEYYKDLDAPNAIISIDNVTTDNIINNIESGEQITLTGAIGAIELGGTADVKITVGGKAFDAVVDTTNNTFSTTIDGGVLKDNSVIKAVLIVTDKAGNSSKVDTEKRYEVDTDIKAVITFDPIAGDNILTQAESAGNVTVTGRVTGEFNVGDVITVRAGNQTQLTTVASDGVFSVALSGKEISSDPDRVVSAILNTTDLAGNNDSIVGVSQQYSVSSTLPNDGTVEINRITADNHINVSEAQENISITGKVTGHASGQEVEIFIGDKIYTTDVSKDKTFGFDVAGSELVGVQGYKIAAQIKGDSNTKGVHSYSVDDYVAAGIEIGAVEMNSLQGSGDQIVRISGTLNFDGTLFAEGANNTRVKAINLSIGQAIYQAGINEENQTFFVDVKLIDLQNANGQNINYTLETSDKVLQLVNKNFGEDHTIEVVDAPLLDSSNTTLVLDTSPFISVNNGLYSIDSSNMQSKLTTDITGKVSGSAQIGDIVTITVAGKSYTTSVLNDMTFKAQISTADLEGKGNTKIEATLNGKDLAGNTISISDETTYSSSNPADGAMVSWTGKLQDYNDLPYFIQALDIETYNGVNYSYGYLDNHEHGNQSGTHTITYYFAKPADGLTYQNQSGEILNNVVSFTNTNKTVVNEALNVFEEYLDIDFKEVYSRQEADISYFMADINGGMLGNRYTAGYAYFGQNVHLAGEVYADNSMSKGSLDSLEGFITAVHETMHSLGATHPFKENMGTNELDTKVESVGVSVMSYEADKDFYDARDLRIYDLAFLQYRYGVNPNARSGNDTYTFKTFNQSKADGDVYIWDGAGVDTFDASQEEQGVYINLTPGSHIYNDKDNRSTHFAVEGELINDAADYFDDIQPSDTFIVVEDTGLNNNYSVYTNIETVYDFSEGHSFIGYGTQIENIKGSDFSDILIGNEANNVVYANGGNDTIDGGKGNDYINGGNGDDRMVGGDGDDVFIVNSTGDVVIEAKDEGNDIVLSSVDYALPENLENLVLLEGAVAGTGNARDNRLLGNNQDNILNGGSGNDKLIGGTGSDTLIGGLGNDAFTFRDVLDGSVDSITDFVVGEDVIELSRDIFGNITQDNILDHILYDKDTGHLSYDRDAEGLVDPVHFATLSESLDIGANSFMVI